MSAGKLRGKLKLELIDLVNLCLKSTPTSFLGRGPRGVMLKAIDCGIVVREFVLKSSYYVHFRANTLGKGMKPLILPAMG